MIDKNFNPPYDFNCVTLVLREERESLDVILIYIITSFISMIIEMTLHDVTTSLNIGEFLPSFLSFIYSSRKLIFFISRFFVFRSSILLMTKSHNGSNVMA